MDLIYEQDNNEDDEITEEDHRVTTKNFKIIGSWDNHVLKLVVDWTKRENINHDCSQFEN